MTTCEFTSGEVHVSSVLPIDLIGLSAMLETPQSPVVEGDHGKVTVENNVSGEEFERDISAAHSTETSNEILCHGRNTLEGGVAVSTPGEEPDCKTRSSRRPRLVPKQYQIDEEVGKKSSRLPEVKESNQFERHHPSPRSPSPRDYRRYHHSPSSQRSEKRSYQRDRPSSPGICNPRYFSQSPPGYPVSPPRRHYSSSPPFPRYGASCNTSVSY